MTGKLISAEFTSASASLESVGTDAEGAGEEADHRRDGTRLSYSIGTVGLTRVPFVPSVAENTRRSKPYPIALVLVWSFGNTAQSPIAACSYRWLPQG